MKNSQLLSILLGFSFAQQAYSAEAAPVTKGCRARVCQAASKLFCTKPCQAFSRTCLGDKTNTPPEVTMVLNEHKKEIKSLAKVQKDGLLWGSKASQPEWLPGYLIKYGVERPGNAQRLQEYINDRNLTEMRVPKKYFSHIPGRPFSLSDDNYMVIVPKAEGVHSDWDSLSPTQHQQLLKIIDIHSDLHDKNFLVTPKEVTIVDTDSRAMPVQLA